MRVQRYYFPIGLVARAEALQFTMEDMETGETIFFASREEQEKARSQSRQ